MIPLYTRKTLRMQSIIKLFISVYQFIYITNLVEDVYNVSNNAIIYANQIGNRYNITYL